MEIENLHVPDECSGGKKDEKGLAGNKVKKSGRME